MFPHLDGVSDVFSPMAIMTGIHLDHSKHLKVPFGAYCEVHDHPTITNTERSRTTSAIALGPSRGDHQAYFFMSLDTGKKILRSKWTELPMTDEIVNRVHEIALQENRNAAADPFDFFYAPNQPIGNQPTTRPAVIGVEGAGPQPIPIVSSDSDSDSDSDDDDVAGDGSASDEDNDDGDAAFSRVPVQVSRRRSRCAPST